MKTVAIALLLMLAACSGDVPVTAEDERAVMEVMLGQYAPPGAPVRISDRALPYWEPAGGALQSNEELRAGLVDDFLAVNRDGPLHDGWVGEWGLGFVDLEEFFVAADQLEDGYERLLRGPPECDGFVRISKPGFSDDGRQALVDVSKQSGPEDGNGAVYLLERTENGWRVVEQLVTWVS